ncbi:hypothetical protein D3C75_744800 [compost metagenome]
MALQQFGYLQRQPVRPAQMAGQHTDDMFSALINDDDRRIGFFVLQKRCDQPDGSAE